MTALTIILFTLTCPLCLAQDCSRFGRKHLDPFLIFSLLALVTLLFVSWFLHLPLLHLPLLLAVLLSHHPRILNTAPCAAGLKTPERGGWIDDLPPASWAQPGKDLLSMALPIRTRSRLPHGQSLPSGSFHKPLILIHQRADRMETIITKN